MSAKTKAKDIEGLLREKMKTREDIEELLRCALEPYVGKRVKLHYHDILSDAECEREHLLSNLAYGDITVVLDGVIAENDARKGYRAYLVTHDDKGDYLIAGSFEQLGGWPDEPDAGELKQIRCGKKVIHGVIPFLGRIEKKTFFKESMERRPGITNRFLEKDYLKKNDMNAVLPEGYREH